MQKYPIVEVVWIDAEEKGEVGWNDLKAMWPTGSIPNIPRQWQL